MHQIAALLETSRKWRYLRPPGPNGHKTDYPAQSRPAEGFTRPMYTCACGYTGPAFHVRILERCRACWAPALVPGVTV
jgi:hypothetical protein